MSAFAQKLTDIVLIGQGSSIATIKQILSYQSRKTFKHYSPASYRFISTNTMVIDGNKISAKRFLILLPQQHTYHKFTGYEEYSDPSHGKATVIIGDGTDAVRHCLNTTQPGIQKTLICEPDVLLREYDTSVQTVVERYMKKNDVRIIKGVSVLSLEPKDSGTDILCEQLGNPLRLSTSTLYISPDTTYATDIGIENIHSEIASLNDEYIQYPANHVLVVLEDMNVGLGSLYKLANSLLTGKKSDQSHIPRKIYSSDTLSFFSAGVLEQDFFSTHLSYKKAVVKIRGQNKLAQWFVKVLTSNKGNIIGIHYVLPFSYKNTDLLIGLVENTVHISELKKFCLVEDELRESFIQLTEDLH